MLSRIDNRIGSLLLATLFSIAGGPHAFAQSGAAGQAIAETQNTAAAKAGKALSDCLLIEVDKAKAANLSKDAFRKVLANACPAEADTARQTLVETLREINASKPWSAEDDRAVDFGVFAIRARAFQNFTGAAK